MIFYERKVVFLTYGDQKFKHSRNRVVQEAKQQGLFTDFVLETDDIKKDFEFKKALESDRFKKVFEEVKGGGCYIWKPYVIYKNLLSLRNNDILVFADAGCKIPNDQKCKSKLNEYFRMLDNDERGIIGLRSHHLESEMSKGDVFDYFGVRHNKDICHSGKFSTGRQFIRKCDHSMRLYEKWWGIAKSDPHLFDSSPSVSKNFPNFIKHIWESSTFSMLYKTMGVIDVLWTEEDVPIKATRIRK